LRCLPCHECVKLDDELFDTDPVILLVVEQIACAWLVTMSGLDLSLFRYDTEDQLFAVFFLNAANTIYGRYGTRSRHALAYPTERLNNRPRKIFGYLTPQEALNKADVALKK
jgi:hypothetical protein